VAINNSASPEIIWGLGGPEEDHQLHHCCWTGRVGEREEEEEDCRNVHKCVKHSSRCGCQGLEHPNSNIYNIK